MGKNSKQKMQTATEVNMKRAEPKQAPKQASTKVSAPGKIALWVLPFLLVVITMLIYSNTFSHRFVLDDHGIIKNNKITKAPVSLANTKTIFSTPLRKGDFSDLENSLYRPAVKMLFNIEWNVFEGDPHKFHIVNVLLYALTGVFIFFIFYDILKKKWVIPFLITLLFLTHPIHTEVVANIKSGDEVLSLLGILMALRCVQLYFSKEKIIYLLLAVAAYLLGSFSKESTVVAVAIFPLFIYLFTKADIKKNILVSSIMLGCTLFFLVCRHYSLSGYPPEAPVNALDNYIVMCKDPAYAGTSKFASAVNTLGLYIKTFLYPHPLSCDYSYSSLIPVGFSDPGFLISFLLLAALFVFAIMKIRPSGKNETAAEGHGISMQAVSFGILWFFIAMSITSNVFFLIGTSFGERLFFVPSLGLIIAIVFALAHYLQKGDEGSFYPTLSKSPLLFGLVFLLAGLYSFKTYSRNDDWKTDFGLFSRDVKYYPNSTHLLFYMGNHLSGSEFAENLEFDINENHLNIDLKDSIRKANLHSIEVFQRALSIYPALPSDGYNQLGKAYFNIGQIDSAYKYYFKAYSEDSTNPIFTNNLGTAFYNSSIPLSNLGVQYQSRGMMDSAQYYLVAGTNKLMSALPYFLKAHRGDTTESDFMNNIGCIYGATQRSDSAIYWFKKASAADPLDLTSVKFLDITYRAIGKVQEADYYKTKTAEVKMRRADKLK
ncbi:transmembrane and TPR repeat-containing protein 1 [Filimonas sp.]|nr:transmembrane and TPR repeat-containing protein 1 [Filimonas sp.]